jgi:hypothetical protein
MRLGRLLERLKPKHSNCRSPSCAAGLARIPQWSGHTLATLMGSQSPARYLAVTHFIRQSGYITHIDLPQDLERSGSETITLRSQRLWDAWWSIAGCRAPLRGCTPGFAGQENK